VQASLVVPVDPAGGHVLDVGEGLVGAVVEDGRGDRLCLEQTDQALHEGVVVGVPDRPDRRGDAFELEVLGEPDARVLAARVGVVQQLAGFDRGALPVPAIGELTGTASQTTHDKPS
jgi:hypothetical protein